MKPVKTIDRLLCVSSRIAALAATGFWAWEYARYPVWQRHQMMAAQNFDSWWLFYPLLTLFAAGMVSAALAGTAVHEAMRSRSMATAAWWFAAAAGILLAGYILDGFFFVRLVH